MSARTASKFLVPVRKRQVLSDKDLYAAAMDVDWWKYLDVDKTFAVDSVVNSKHFNHSKYAALKVKDAIADRFREKYGKRPSVDRENPDVRINVHIDRERCAISLDSSGEPLHRRGYRLEGGGAPLNEVLAAGMIMLSGWRGEGELHRSDVRIGDAARRGGFHSGQRGAGASEETVRVLRLERFRRGALRQDLVPSSKRGRGPPLRRYADPTSRKGPSRRPGKISAARASKRR